MSDASTTAGTLDRRFSDPAAEASTWQEAREVLRSAGTYWLTTVRADGRPHVTTLIAVWDGEALYFCTGPGEQKARNLTTNPHVVLTTGSNALKDGLDVVAEGEAVRVTDPVRLGQLADAWVGKYGEEWRFEVGDEGFAHQAGPAVVFEVAPTTVFGFRKGGTYGQTRWRLR